jgi:uncharacterized protein
MQSLDAATSLAEVDRDLIRPRIQALLEMCGRGDVDGMMQYFAPDIVYTGGTWRVHPFSTPRAGKQACADMMRAVYVSYENLGTIIRHVVIDGDRAAVSRTTQLRHRGSGRIADVEIWDYIRFRDGLVVEFSEYPDTLAIGSLEGHD